MTPLPIDRFMTLKEVCKVVCLSRTEIMGDGSEDRPGRVKLKTFPKHLPRTHRNSKLLWRESWIIKWMDEQEAKPDFTSATASNDDRVEKGERFVTLKEVCDVTSLSRTDIPIDAT